MTHDSLIQVALGNHPADLLLKNAQVLNVFTGEILVQDIAIAEGRIAGLGTYHQGHQIEDLQGAYVSPGFINAHCHVESSMVTPAAYCMEELRWGVTTLVTDPHEVANVAGADGIHYMLESTRDLPIDYYVMLPSCVPATPFEHAGAVLDAEALAPFLLQDRVLGLGEMMDYPGLFAGQPQLMEKLALFAGRIIDGHAPGVVGRPLQAYAAAGIRTDHESTTVEEAVQKLRAGISLLVREGTASRNLETLMQGILAHQLQHASIAFCTDDKHIAHIRKEGTIRCHIRRSIELGLDVPSAYRMATLNAARIYGLRNHGAVAPGFFANLIILKDLKSVEIENVFYRGKQVGGDAMPPQTQTGQGRSSVHLAPFSSGSLDLPGRIPGEMYPVIRMVTGEILTEREEVPCDWIDAMLERGQLNKLAVVERHHATGAMGVGLLGGYGLRSGALAATVAHDSHNLIIVGTRDEDMRRAAEEARAMGGGFVLVDGGRVIDRLPLPLFGLMSDAPTDDLISRLEHMTRSLRLWGVPDSMDPFVPLSFLALPVIPKLRLTDRGLFDVETFSFVFGGTDNAEP